MMDSQLMGEFEFDVKDLEADSWSGTVDKKFLKALKKDEIKRQDVIYELYQTEFHHVRTLKIMSEVYYKGLQKELQLDTHTLDKIFPVLDNLLDMHTHFLTLLLERKRASSAEGQNNNSFLICSIGDVLVNKLSLRKLACIHDGGFGFSGDVELDVISITVEAETMTAYEVTNGENVQDEQEGAKH
ncbi:rho guanine nucleotide exchange factor 2-like [Morone saxatilis]|uniref:rho guanine nucleotide exchange factor 2-like n=1 Tax=Morone saxatilis TaxID=34816 RepID=UPI0015E22242|nr:rho guanine nucleotide exchange factor 2-like [Morone saxatilis]